MTAGVSCSHGALRVTLDAVTGRSYKAINDLNGALIDFSAAVQVRGQPPL